MTRTTIPPRWARCAATLTGLLVIPALAAGCAQNPDESSATEGGGEGAADGGGDAAATPVVDPACPSGLTAQQLSAAVEYAPVDVDGDSVKDTVSIGTVTGGDAGCSAALVVTTDDGTAVAALPGLEIMPPKAFVAGGAATVAGQTVLAAPVSFSPRGGGEVGLFTLRDGALVAVETGDGKPWTILATVDDSGGVPQSIGCAQNGLTHTVASQNGLGSPFHIITTHFTLDGSTLVKDGQSRRTVSGGAAAGGHGLTIFADC